MRRALPSLIALLLLSGWGEGGRAGERLSTSTRERCDDCPLEPTCPDLERCADDTVGLRFSAPRARTCAPLYETGSAILGSAPFPPVAVGGTMTLTISNLHFRDAMPGAITATANRSVLAARELFVDSETGEHRLVLEGVAEGSSSIAIRRVDGDLLIDRIQVEAAPMASVRMVAPAAIGCVRPTPVRYRPVEVAPIPELTSLAGDILVDESARVLTDDGAPLGPIAAGVERVSLVVAAGGTRTALELEVVDRADAIERAAAARDFMTDQTARATEFLHCYRAVNGDREVVGAAFVFEIETATRRRRIDPFPGSPQCILPTEIPAGAVLHVSAAGAERAERRR